MYISGLDEESSSSSCDGIRLPYTVPTQTVDDCSVGKSLFLSR